MLKDKYKTLKKRKAKVKDTGEAYQSLNDHEKMVKAKAEFIVTRFYQMNLKTFNGGTTLLHALPTGNDSGGDKLLPKHFLKNCFRTIC
ncbi:phage capsid family protein [Staphylococcus aureus]|nr:phage capsid family protein [Staphylococcus aureus]